MRTIKERIYFIRQIVPCLKGLLYSYVFISLLQIMISIVAFFYPFIYQKFIDLVLVDKYISFFPQICFCYLFLFIIKSLSEYVSFSISALSINKLTLKVKTKIYDNIVDRCFENELTTGNSKILLEDDTKVLDFFVGEKIVKYFLNILLVIASSCIMMKMNVLLSVFSFVVIPLSIYADLLIGKIQCDLVESNRLNDEYMTSFLNDSFLNWKEVKNYNKEHYEIKTYLHLFHNYAVYLSKNIHLTTFRQISFPKIKDELLMKIGIYFIGGLLIINNGLTIGMIFAFVQYFNILTQSINYITDQDADFVSNTTIICRIISQTKKVINKKTFKAIKVITSETRKEFDVENLSFSYPSKLIISNLNFEVKKGEVIAITGKSGCGKTTLLKLLAGVLKPERGEIKFRNENITSYKLDEYFMHVKFISQNCNLFNISIKENLLICNPNASMEKLRKICKIVDIDEDIMSMDRGYDTLVKESGKNLSGGQKQKLILARVMLQEGYQIILLDEATSSIDKECEARIMKYFFTTKKERTLLFITHNDKLLRFCDRIIAL